MDTVTLRAQLERYQSFLARDPDNTALLGQVADLQIRLGDLEDAQILLDEALDRQPDDAGLKYRLASIALTRSDGETAAHILRELLAAGVDAPGIRYNLAYAELMSGRPIEAKAQLERIGDSVDEAPDTPLLLARVLHHLGDLEGAMHQARDYLQRQPQSAEALGVMALLNLDADQEDEARNWAEQALALNPENLESLVTLGSVALAQFEPERAGTCFRHAVERYPSSGRAWSGLGLLHMMQQDLPAAVEALKQSVRYMPGHIGTWHALAWAQLMSKDIQGGKESFQAAMDIDHSFGETHGGLAVAAVMENRDEEARDLIKRALRLNPMAFSARFAQSLLIAKAGDEGRAQRMIERILDSQIEEGSGTLKESLAKLLRQGKKERH